MTIRRANHSSSGGRGTSTEKSPVSRIVSAASARARAATQVKPPPTLTRCAPASTISTKLSPIPQRQHVDRFGDGVAHRPYLFDAAQSRCVQDVGSHLFESAQSRDGVVDVGIAADVVLGSRGQRERKPQTPRSIDRGGDSLGGVGQLIQVPIGVVVLDRAADRAGRGDARDRERDAVGVSPVAVLEVNRQREISGAVERGRMLDHLVKRDVAVETTEREGHAGAGAGQCSEAESREHARGARVPRIGDHERFA